MSDTAGQQKDHPGVVALRERIARVRQAVEYWERAAKPTEAEASVLAEIESLQERLRHIRRHRDESGAQLETRRAELAKLEQLMVSCNADSRIAKAVWLKLLVQAQEEQAATKKARQAVGRRVV